MAEQSNRSKSSGQSKARKKTSSQKTTSSPRKSPKPPPPPRPVEPSLTQRFTNFTGGLTVGAFKLAAKTGGVSLRMARALLLSAEQLQLLSPEQAKMMRETGAYLKDLREVAGLTRDELSQAIDLSDKTLMEAVENGTATISFELILRLAALLARHDPVPFIIQMLRTYNPDLWRLLEDWGIGRLPLHFERERHFINIYRRHDVARQLSDEGFQEVLGFTRSAFEMGLHFAAKREGLLEEFKAEEAAAGGEATEDEADQEDRQR